MLNLFRSSQPRLTAGTIYYRVESGRTDYGFSIEPRENGLLRIYITSHPSYGRRATDTHSTHRLSDGGRYYICWDNAIRSEKDARAVIKLWSEKTERYILYGERF